MKHKVHLIINNWGIELRFRTSVRLTSCVMAVRGTWCGLYVNLWDVRSILIERKITQGARSDNTQEALRESYYSLAEAQ